MKYNNSSPVFFIVTLAILLSTFTFKQLNASPPDWASPTGLQYNMMMIAQLQYTDGTISLNAEDIVGAFVGEECRGIGNPIPSFNGMIFLMVSSNIQSGENVVFKAYTQSEDIVVDIVETITFVNQGEEGTIDNPFILSIVPACQDATANAGEDAIICEGENIQLTGAAENYESVLWQTNGDGTFEDATNPQTTYYPGSGDITNGNTELCLTAFAEEPCEDATACLILEIMPQPLVDAGPDLSVCEGQTVTLNQSTVANYAGISWTSSGDGVFSNPNSPFTSYSPGPMDLANGSVELTLTASGVSPCVGSVSDEITVNIEEMPTIDIGSDYIICEDETIILTGLNLPGFECGLLVNGYPFAGNIYIPTPGDIAAGSIEFCIVCEAPPPCSGEISDCLTVFIQQNPSVTAGVDQTIVAGTEVFLNATAENYSSLEWTTSGNGTFDETTILDPAYYPTIQDFENGSVQLTLFANAQSPCMTSFSDNLTIYCEAQIIDMGPDETVCENVESISLPSGVSEGNWSTYELTYGDGTFDYSNPVPISFPWTVPYIPGSNDLSEGFVEFCLTFYYASPPGYSASDCKIYYFQDLPTADAGEDMTILQNETATLNATANNYNSLLWTTTGDGSFNNASSLDPVYTPGTVDISSGSTQLCLHAEAISPCIVDSSDCLDVNILPNPFITDSLALVALYNSTKLPGWLHNENWLTGPLNTWHGIIVENGRVTEVDLGSNYLVGIVPETIGQLTSLQYLNLGYNALEGGIPDIFENFSDLQYLHLGYNSLIGSIPVSLGFCNNLQHLSLFQNQLSGNIPEVLCDLINLQYLSLSKNQLSGSIPAGIGNLENLQIIYCYNNQLTGNIPESLGNLTNLESLYLNNNQLTGSIPVSMCSDLPNIHTLTLNNNNFGWEECPSIQCMINREGWILFEHSPQNDGFVFMEDCGSTLYSDSLALVALYNSTNGVDWDNNLNWLTGLVSNWHGVVVEEGRVTEINLGYPGNNLVGLLPNEIGDLNKLKHLHLSLNQISGNIPESIENLIELETLWLSTNQLSGNIPEGIGNLENLESIYFDNNQLEGEIPASMCTGLVNLNTLWIINNNFGIEDCPSIQCMIDREGWTLFEHSPQNNGFVFMEDCGSSLYSDSLALVALYNSTNGDNWTNHENWLTGSVSDWYGIVIEDGRVTEINLGYPGNNLVGVLPNEIGDLNKLKHLHLSLNQISGNIPESIENLAELETLWLSTNQLSGIIPEGIGNLENLESIYFDNNQLEGEIPASMCTGLVNLNTLWIINNNFGIEDCPTIQCMIDREGWTLFEHSPQNNGFVFMEDCIPPCEDATATAGDDAIICEGETIQLSSTAENYSSLLWTGGLGEFDDVTLLNPVYTPDAAEFGTLVTLCLTAFAEGTCADSTDCMELIIISLPTVDVGEDISVCDNITSIPLYALASNFSFVEWQSTGDGFFMDENSVSTEYIPGSDDIQSGSMDLCLVAYPINPPCTTSSEDCLTLILIPSPMPYAGSNATICEGDIFELGEASAENYNTVEWTTSGDGLFSDNSSINPVYTPGPEDIANGEVELTIEAMPLSGCNNSAFESMNLTIVAPPNFNMEEDVWLDCENYDYSTDEWMPIALCPDGQNISAVQWTANGDGYFDDANALCTNYTLGDFEKCGGEVELTIQAFGPGNCGVVAYQMTTLHVPGQLITVPSDGWTGISSYIDKYSSSVPEVLDAVKWQLDSIYDVNGHFYEPLSGINQIGNWKPEGYKAKFSDQVCLPIYGNRLIDQTFAVHGPETILPVLTDVPVNIDDLMANHLDDIFIIYCWKTGNIWLPGSVSPLETLLPGRAYLLRTVEGAVPFEIQFPPYQSPCEGSSPDHYSISGNVTIADNDTLLPLENVSIQFTNIGEILSNASGHYSMNVPLGWSGTVTPSKDELTFEPANRNYSNLSWYKSEQDFQAMPNCPTADAGDDVNICENESFQLDGQAENYTSILWETSGDGTFADSTSLQSTYFPGSGDLALGEAELCLTAFAQEPCADATDCMELIIVHSPIVDAGDDISVCDNITSIPVNAVASNFSSVLWQTSGDGFFSDETALNTEYSPGFDDLQSGSVNLYLIVYPIDPPCSAPAEDSLKITFIPSPITAPLSDEIICAGESVQFSGVAVDNYSSLAWTTNGDGVFDDPTSSDPAYTPGSQDISTGEVILCLEALPLAGCTVSASECMSLSIYPAPEVNAGSNQTIPSSETATLNATANNYSSVLWTTLGDGIFPDPYSLNTNYTPGIQDISTGSVELCISAEAMSPCVGTVSDCLDLTILPDGEDYFQTVWENPFQPMNIYIYKATIDQINMVAGDEIGIFDIDPDTSEEICVGAGVLTGELQNSSFLQIITSMDDGTGPTNGFQPGHAIIYKLWSNETGEVDQVIPVYPYPGYDEVFTLLGSAHVELEGFTLVTQTLGFSPNWNLISMRVVPDSLDMPNIFNPVIELDQLIKILDQDGNSFEHIPVPAPYGQWVNSIGNWTLEQGYYGKFTEATTLSITAAPVEIPMEIPLRAAWNIIGMPCPVAQSTQEMLQPLIDNGILKKVINEQGLTIEFIPVPLPYGHWNFGITSFEPGEGYYIKANEAASLFFDCESPANSEDKNIRIEPEHFEPSYQNNPYMPMSVALTGFDELLPGDEIGIFDGEVCVGAAVVAENEYLVFPVSMDDPTTELPDGFVQGNELRAEIWQQQSNNTFPADLIYMDGFENFQPLETYIGDIKPLITGINGSSVFGLTVSVMPNPFNDHTSVYYNLPESGNVEIALFDLAGKKQFIVAQDNFSAGNGKIKLDSHGLQPGCYILKFTFSSNNNQSSINKKLIIR